jgi:hypothetical protein
LLFSIYYSNCFYVLLMNFIGEMQLYLSALSLLFFICAIIEITLNKLWFLFFNYLNLSLMLHSFPVLFFFLLCPYHCLILNHSIYMRSTKGQYLAKTIFLVIFIYFTLLFYYFLISAKASTIFIILKFVNHSYF